MLKGVSIRDLEVHVAHVAVSHLTWLLETKLGNLEEWQVLLTAEPYLQPLRIF